MSIVKQLLDPQKICHIFKRGFRVGYCPVCGERTLFFKTGDWLRDHFFCVRCRSIPRGRALFLVLSEQFPNWRELIIHESSPGSPTYEFFSAANANYVPTRFFPNIAPGTTHHGFRCEDLARQTFGNETFDMVVTQDVLEHLLEPGAAFREIARTLKPGGVHLFTVPWYHWQETRIRARMNNNVIEYLETPEYHDNLVDAKGALVVTEWGKDLCDTIYASSGMTTTVVRIFDRRCGIEAQFIEVFISRKYANGGNYLLNRWNAQFSELEDNKTSALIGYPVEV